MGTLTSRHSRKQCYKDSDLRKSVNHYETLIALLQDSTVDDFRERFELLSAPLREADEEFLIGAFSNGLAEEIKAELRMVRPASLVQVMDLAQKVAEKNWALERAQVKKFSRPIPNVEGAKISRIRDSFGLRKSAMGGYSNYSVGGTSGISIGGISGIPLKTAEGIGVVSGATRTNSNSSHSNISVNKDQLPNSPQFTWNNENFKRISNAKMQRQRERDLCFRCEEKWRFGHVCKNPQLQVIIAAVDEDNGDRVAAIVEEEPGEPTAEQGAVT